MTTALGHRRVDDRSPWGRLLIAPVSLALIAFAAVLLGAATRQGEFLSVLWPVDALILGVMVRMEAWRRPGLWVGVALGYVVGEVLVHGVAMGLLAASAGLTGVAVGATLFALASPEDRRLRRPLSVLVVVGICLAMAASSAAVGGWIEPLFRDGDLTRGAALWAVSMLANSLALLPALLSGPNPATISRWGRGARTGTRQAHTVGAAGLLIVALLGGVAVGGVSGLLFPLPVLLWAALNLGVFTTSALTYLSTVGFMVAFIGGWHSVDVGWEGPDGHLAEHLALALVALGPIVVAANLAARDDALRRLGEAAAHDPLTGVLGRRTFMMQADEALAGALRSGRPCAVMMLDVDHFKQVNDTHGHAGGDAVLRAYAATVERCLRTHDLLGRVGGEEFAVVLADATLPAASAVAERVREAVSGLRVHHNNRSIAVTVSVGVAHFDIPPAAIADGLMLADQALYRAKGSGRDRVVVIAPPPI